MFVSFLGIVLLSLRTAGSRGITEIPQTLARLSASPGATVNISCNIPEGTFVSVVSWYKEEHEGGLRRIADIYTTQTPGAKTPSQVNLTRHNVQGRDSGVYYCAGALAQKFTFLCGVRLIVLGTSGPRLSLLAPSTAEDTELSHHLPLLCLLIDANPDEDTFSWDIGGETSQDRKDGDVIDGEGAFTVWSLKLIPQERWSQGMVYSCSDQEKRNISAVVPSNAASTTQEDCRNILLIGIPCLVVVLLIPPLVLLCRKLRSGGNVDAPVNQLPMREIPQTEYAEVRCKK
ncbi:immunoglobulin gamma-1 heavy chain-like isoform X1 [Podarcis lilfordi]|nr:immunoglobulin gamma-1 heavy chain-like isoform X1 [Podarcis lilfordi]